MNFFGNLFSSFSRKKDIKLILQPNQYIELMDPSGNMQGALLIHDSKTKDELLKYFKNSRENNLLGHNGYISDAIVDKIGCTSSIISSAIQSGHLMQIVGTPNLIEGLKTGTMSLLSTGESFTGSVISKTTNQIVGQLRFAPADVAPIIAPMAVWQVINAIAGVQQLAKINLRLDTIQRTVDSIVFRMQANVYGRLCAVIASLSEIDKQYRTIGYFSDDMSFRLAIATSEIQTVFFEQGFLIKRFTEKSKSILENTKKKEGAYSANQLLKEEEQTFLIDASIYIAATRAALLASKSWILHDLNKVPEYVTNRNISIRQEIKNLEESFKVLSIIDELKEHSLKCLDEMSWFSKNLFNRTLKKEITERTNNNNLKEQDEMDKIEPSILIWKSEDQKLNCISIVSKIE
ncbi:MAG: hypothetical protein NUV32_09235 [Exilispira sp.]|jgi:pimeloyl-CoA synthetase|nr:hypothetical protein [Exilispira sp.]